MAKPVKSRSKLVKELDRVFSIYIRQRGMKNGTNECVCCGKNDRWEKLQNGHYCSRSNYSTRWDDTNCWPCCVGCNVFKNGNYPAFTEFLLKELGTEKLQALIKKSKQVCKITNEEIIEKTAYYKTKIVVDKNK